LRQVGYDLSPEISAEHFAGRVFQSGYLVEMSMVQFVQDRLDYAFDVSEIDDPSGIRIGPAGNVHIDAIAVPVKPLALVSFRDVRQRVGRFESECLD